MDGFAGIEDCAGPVFAAPVPEAMDADCFVMGCDCRGVGPLFIAGESVAGGGLSGILEVEAIGAARGASGGGGFGAGVKSCTLGRGSTRAGRAFGGSGADGGVRP